MSHGEYVAADAPDTAHLIDAIDRIIWGSAASERYRVSCIRVDANADPGEVSTAFWVDIDNGRLVKVVVIHPDDIAAIRKRAKHERNQYPRLGSRYVAVVEGDAAEADASQGLRICGLPVRGLSVQW